ncbi:MAG: type I-E CRISPR-associated protein Cse2/CasB [Pyrinomonadaceae bacterium]|nr:type I-E CRISPR-associated protein Cse2/CasB [Pyrinomonadaceae bacterium]
MSTKEKELRPEERFVAYLQRLVDEEDRAPLASLRRGLGKAPGEAAEVMRYVLPRMPQNASRWDEDAYFLVATLFALHQINWPSSKDSTQATNLGASFARLGREVESESIEKRFVALLNCHQDDLPTHLRHAVSLLKSKEIPIDWARLLRDVRGWNHADRYVQRNWARAFWANSAAAEQPSSDQSNQEVNETTPPAKGEN